MLITLPALEVAFPRHYGVLFSGSLLYASVVCFGFGALFTHVARTAQREFAKSRSKERKATKFDVWCAAAGRMEPRPTVVPALTA